LTSLKEKLIKIGAKVVSHGRYVAPPFGAPTVAAFVRAASPYCENAAKAQQSTPAQVILAPSEGAPPRKNPGPRGTGGLTQSGGNSLN
jgi:hypothetical protein